MTIMTKLENFLILGSIILFSVMGCSKKDTTPADDGITTPVLTTDSVSAISEYTATSGGTITSDGGSPVTKRGVCWSKTPDPQITDDHTSDGTGTGSFTSQLTGLDTNTLYYVRAYASNSKGTAYGNTQSFKTLSIVIYDSVFDIDGHKYTVIPIGNQFWLRENLWVTRYRNGDVIPKVTTDAQWKIMAVGAWCFYDNLQSNDSVYGNLYNWHALGDPRGLCPLGWHVASDSEWIELSEFLGGDSVSGGKMKSTGTIEQNSGLWYAPNKSADNSSGFSGLPGGYRINYGTFYSLGNVAYFWSSSDTALVNAWNYILDANNGKLNRNFNLKTNGFSIRCTKD